MDLIKHVEAAYLKKKIPAIRPGFIVAVHQKIKEGKKERIQVFKGVVIKVKGGFGINGSFTVRRVASGVGVEKTFLFNSPLIEKIVVLKQAKVRRSKLYYLRGRFGKAAKLNILGEGAISDEEILREIVGEDITKEENVAEQEVESVKKAEKNSKSEKKVEKIDSVKSDKVKKEISDVGEVEKKEKNTNTKK